VPCSWAASAPLVCVKSCELLELGAEHGGCRGTYTIQHTHQAATGARTRVRVLDRGYKGGAGWPATAASLLQQLLLFSRGGYGSVFTTGLCIVFYESLSSDSRFRFTSDSAPPLAGRRLSAAAAAHGRPMFDLGSIELLPSRCMHYGVGLRSKHSLASADGVRYQTAIRCIQIKTPLGSRDVGTPNTSSQ